MKKIKLIASLVVIAIVLFASFLFYQAFQSQSKIFDGQRALRNVELQVAFGPRLPGSEAHQRTVNWMQDELKKAGWQTELQETTRLGHPIRNVIAKRGNGTTWVIIGAHYDTRLLADNDPNPGKRSQAVPGANDGASGVAVLLELARVLPETLDQQVWLVFFDAEDQGSLPGWDWIMGSRAFAESLTSKPDAVVIIDMIGDANLTIYQEQSSDRALSQYIWEIAAQVGYSKNFIPSAKYNILDDHVPFLERGIRAVDIIDIEYPHWHTTSDTPDKVSAQSLKTIGEILIKWLNKPLP